MRVRLEPALALGALAGTLFGVWFGRLPPNQTSQVAFLSVGQGDCTVFQSEGKTLLLDAAPRTDTFDAGERMAAPQLYRLGVKTLDVVVLTHPDSDHVGGLRALARRFPIGTVICSSAFRQNKDMNEALNSASPWLRRVAWVDERSTLSLGKWRFRIDAPSVAETDNDGSLFVRGELGEFSVQSSGDASVPVEEKVVGRPGPWQADVMLAGHHGSKSSTGDAWMAAVSPEVLMVSAGRKNRFGHPHPETLQMAAKHGARVLRTDRDGTLVFDSTGRHRKL